MREFDNRRRAHFWGVSRVDGRESGWERWLRERPRLSRLVAASSAPQLAPVGAARLGSCRYPPILSKPSKICTRMQYFPLRLDI